MSADQIEARILFTPDSATLKCLPEGPCPCGDGRLSWVGIQHAMEGDDAKVGSINIIDTGTGDNESHTLSGRPGLAFETTEPRAYIAGVERNLVLQRLPEPGGEVPAPILGPAVTDEDGDCVINDGEAFERGIVFGTKNPRFDGPTANLYLWRYGGDEVVRLRGEQTCSNGKILAPAGDQWKLIDVDSPEQTVVTYELDVDAGTVSEPTTIVSSFGKDEYPDGMVATPDGKSVIVAVYNANDPESGEARQFSIADGSLERVWLTPGAPRVTCPRLIEIDGKVKLILTTAIEAMPAEMQAQLANSGCMFIGDTPFEVTPTMKPFVPPVPSW